MPRYAGRLLSVARERAVEEWEGRGMDVEDSEEGLGGASSREGGR